MLFEQIESFHTGGSAYGQAGMLLAIQTVGFRGRNNFVVRLVGCQLCVQNGVRSVFWRSLGVNYTVSVARRLVGWG